jgi:hypothetical protein
MVYIVTKYENDGTENTIGVFSTPQKAIDCTKLHKTFKKKHAIDMDDVHKRLVDRGYVIFGTKTYFRIARWELDKM